jgi:mannose PTS system EIIA component
VGSAQAHPHVPSLGYRRAIFIQGLAFMPGLLIIAHAPLASALKTVAEHAFPDCVKQLATLDIPPEMGFDEALGLAQKLVAQVATPDTLVLTDVFGATPCNVAQHLVDGHHTLAIAGVNVPMLWRSLCYVHETLDQLWVRALEGATQGVIQVSPLSPKPARHD